MVNVLVVEDSRITRETIERRLADSGRYSVIASLENAANAVIACMRDKVDLILMDVCTADDESGIEAAAVIRQHYPRIRIIAMTSMPEYSFLKKARESGCNSFWYKEDGKEDLLDVCDATMLGKDVWPEGTPGIRVGLADSREFTERELEVIRALASGDRYEEIASRLYMSTNTVKYHVKNILQKTGYHNTLQLVAEVIEHRLVLPKY